MPAPPESLYPDLYRAALEASPSPMLVADEDGVIVLANRELERLFGWEPGTLVGSSVDLLLPEALRTGHAAHRARFAAEPASRPMGRQRDLQARHRDGTVFPVEVGLSPVRTAGGLYVACALMDQTERRKVRDELAQQASRLQEANARLTEMASTDHLTALWNRRAFLEQMDIGLELAVRDARPLSVLIIDVDHFKPYNDEFGHLAGDEVLGGTAQLLRQLARRSDFLARIGGEEFGVLLHAADEEGAVRQAERFRQGIEAAPWPRRRITISVGAETATFQKPVPRPAMPAPSQLLAAADRALYYSKEHGRNRVTHAHHLAMSTGTERGVDYGSPPGDQVLH
ncbi:MAG: sensor domain-containing diguanylate cyclase [Gemmatimonadota bacterium]|nr:sensor domain-containing diguanylate cyclase [Gemmatimonadota bacterium]MDH5283735.1 sensor domain-containing diguanylate cyclase [Gemmatimonadota bacterium]